MAASVAHAVELHLHASELYSVQAARQTGKVRADSCSPVPPSCERLSRVCCPLQAPHILRRNLSYVESSAKGLQPPPQGCASHPPPLPSRRRRLRMCPSASSGCAETH